MAGFFGKQRDQDRSRSEERDRKVGKKYVPSVLRSQDQALVKGIRPRTEQLSRRTAYLQRIQLAHSRNIPCPYP